MSRERGGKRIRIRVEEISYPHCNSSKGRPTSTIQIFDSSWSRPKNAVHKLVVFLGDKGYMFSWDWFVDYLNKGKE